MKNLLFICAIIGMYTAHATAATKCVPINDTATCNFNTVKWTMNSPDFSIDCTTNGATVRVKGIGVCTNLWAYNSFGSYDTLPRGDSNEAKNCWCKITTPFESPWITQSGLGFVDATERSQACGLMCSVTMLLNEQLSDTAPINPIVFLPAVNKIYAPA